VLSYKLLDVIERINYGYVLFAQRACLAYRNIDIEMFVAYSFADIKVLGGCSAVADYNKVAISASTNRKDS
jgi:hypothetical protein